MDKKVTKRIIIILIYLFIIALVSWFFYGIMKPKETCTDKIKNQNEENVDCGGSCSPCKKIEADNLNVGDKGFLPSGNDGQYDFWVKVSNPNATFGAANFNYKIVFKGADGSVTGEKYGKGFILPSDEKYVIENNIPATDPAGVEFSITDVSWNEINDYYEKPQLDIVNRTYGEISSGTGFSEAKGLLKNKSPFDFNVIKVDVLLKDKEGKIIAINSTEVRAVKAQEEREVKAYWPRRFPGEVGNVDAQAEVNIYDPNIFLKRFFKEQEFQRY
jgi:hypothetical protein